MSSSSNSNIKTSIVNDSYLEIIIDNNNNNTIKIDPGLSNNNKYLETNIDEIIESSSDSSSETTSDHTNDSSDNKIIQFICENHYNIFVFNSILLIISLLVLVTITLLYYPELSYKFWINQLSKYFLIMIIQYLMALLVIYKNIKVNYTRKVVHISYFLWPQLLDIKLLNYDKTKITEFWNVWIIFFLLYMVSHYLREKITLINTLFKAVDRPEDRPYTLIWFASQIITTLIVVLPFSVYFSRIGKTGLIFIPILINGLADGLAEPVGITFGKHKYKTRACLSTRKYERSYEGSLCVFIVSTIIIACYYKYLSTNHYVFYLTLIPIITTFAEAYAPHTWDSPTIFFVVCSLLVIPSLADF
jgi:phytol kinase